jgi:hypothetical protein
MVSTRPLWNSTGRSSVSLIAVRILSVELRL